MYMYYALLLSYSVLTYKDDQHSLVKMLSIKLWIVSKLLYSYIYS